MSYTSPYIKAGDVVCLKGTTMKMTVESVTICPAPYPALDYVVNVHCVWFDRDEQLNRKTFRKEELEKVESYQFYSSLRKANDARQKEWWPSGSEVSLSFRGNELAGEAGEACNILKKLDRERMGLKGSRATKEELADELADVIICVDLIASDMDISLNKAVIKKFNKTSEKHGFKTRMH